MKHIFLLILVFGISVAQAQQYITPEWLWRLGRVSILDISNEHDLVLYKVTKSDVKENTSHTTIYTMRQDGSRVKVVYDGDVPLSNIVFHPTEKKLVYLKDGTLEEMDLDGKNAKVISKEKMEMFKLSPDGKKVAFTRSVKHDQTISDLYPNQTKANVLVYDDLFYRHWKSWSDGTYSNLFVHKLGTDKAKNILNGPYDTPLKPFGGMDQITWSSNSDIIYYTTKMLKGKESAVSVNSDIFGYHLATGVLQNLTTKNKGYDMEPNISPDGKMMVYNSMEGEDNEADVNRAILLDLSSLERININKKFDHNANHPKFSSDGRKIYYMAGVEATKQLFSYDIATKKTKQVTKGVHNVNDFYPAKNGVITRITSMTDAAEIFHVSDNGEITQLTDVNKEGYHNVKKAIVKEKWIETTDKKKMKVWYILPPDFDPKKKYPTLLYCQGGPQSAVSQFFSYRWNFQLMAAQGYVIVAPNRRGLPSFGKEWNDDILRDWGGQAMEDYLSAIDDAIENEPYVDKDRVGAIGASFGGYSVFWLAGNHKGRFKTFISHCGMFNLESWYLTTEEMFFPLCNVGGGYWEKGLQKEYDKFSPHRYAANWDTPMLIIHGAKDYRVPIQEGLQAYGLAQMKGIKSRILLFPDEGHWVHKPQNSLIWHHEFLRWLKETL